MRVEELERELRAERPEPDLDFARGWTSGPRPGSRAIAGSARAPPSARARLAARLGPAHARPRRGGCCCRRARWRPWSWSPGSRSARSTTPATDDASSVAPRRPPTAAAEQASSAERRRRRSRAVGAGDAGGARRGRCRRPPTAAPARRAPTSARPRHRPRHRRADRRRRRARLSLGAEADEVQEVANGVVEVTDRYDGVVVDSQVTSRRRPAPAPRSSSRSPTRELDAALADLSELGDVISRTETTEDITAQAVRARKDLAGPARAHPRGADRADRGRHPRGAADPASRRSPRSRRAPTPRRPSSTGSSARAASPRSSVDDHAPNGPADEDGGWSLGDAFDDAGRVLEVIGGIALVSLAVLVPLALVAALAAFGISRAPRPGPRAGARRLGRALSRRRARSRPCGRRRRGRTRSPGSRRRRCRAGCRRRGRRRRGRR